MDTIALLLVYCLGFMHHAQPILARSSWDRAAEEIRYEQIASAAISVAFEPDEEPIYKGSDGRAKTAMLLLSIASNESHFRADVEAGHCRKGECDGGAAAGETQIHTGQGIKLLENGGYAYDRHGYHARDIIEDRVLMFRITLHMVRDSFRQCGDLSAFTTGEKCPKNEKKAKWREHQAELWLSAHPLPQ